MNETAQSKKRTWVWVLVGVFFVFVVLAIGGVVFSVAFFQQSMSINAMSETSATEQFDAVRARFPGQQALIQLVDDRPQFIVDRATRTASTTSLKTLHVMAWDEDEEKLVTFSIPFWLLPQGWDDRGVSFRVEDIEKAGPGLILDVNERRDGRVLIWAE